MTWNFGGIIRIGGTAYPIYTCYKKLNQPKQAVEWLEKIALLGMQILGNDHIRTKNTIKELLDYSKKLGEVEMINK